MRAEKAVQENRIFSMASEIGEFIGNRAYRALLAEVYTTPKPGLVDLFTRQARKSVQEKEKGSVLQKLKQELPAHKPAAPKKREPER